jgi:hypothetical protein
LKRRNFLASIAAFSLFGSEAWAAKKTSAKAAKASKPAKSGKPGKQAKAKGSKKSAQASWQTRFGTPRSPGCPYRR